MRTNYWMRLFTIGVVLAGGVNTSPAQATEAKDGIAGIFNFVFGDAKHRESHDVCGDGDLEDSSKTGVMGLVDNIACHLEKDMGITGVGNADKNFGFVRIKCAVAGADGAATYSVNSATFDKNAQCWVSVNAGTFYRLFNWYFSYSSDKTINKGVLLSDPLSYRGSNGTGAFLQYDLGTATVAKNILVKHVNPSFKFRGEGFKDATGVLKSTGIYSGNSQLARFSSAMSVPAADKSRNVLASYELTGGAGSCTTGAKAVQSAAVSDAPTCSQCYACTRSGDDNNCVATAGVCSALTEPNYPAESATTVSGYTADSVCATSVLCASSTGTFWNGMATLPTF